MSRSKVTLLITALTLLACVVSASEFPYRPWSPPQLRGRSVSIWGRTYDFSKSILPSAITSAGEDILAAPMRLEAVAGSEKVIWTDAAFRSESIGGEAVSYSVTTSGKGITAKCSYTTEFDGVTKVVLSFDADKETHIDSLNLVIPLKKEYAELFHHSSVYPVHVWDWPKKRMNAGSVGKDGLKLPFVFHLWLGNDDRGIQVFSESDEAWFPANVESAITVTPGKDTTELRMSLLSDYELKGPWEWTFGFVATPVKPYPDNRSAIHYCHMGGYGIDKISYGGVPADEKNPALIDVYKQVGVNFLGFHENWSNEQSLPRPKNPEDLKSLVKACHDRGIRLVTYTGCYMSTKSPEYSKDWDMLPLGDHYQYQRPDTGDICRAVCNNTGWPDLLVKSYKTAFDEWGLDGVYMDGFTCPLACTNTKHGCGYIGKDAQIHPTMPIWRTREAMKSFYKLIKNREKPGIIVSHMSGSVLLPALSFADMYFEGEHLLAYMKIGSPEYSEDILRAEMSGHNFGIPGTQLPIRGDKAEQERARTICLLHDILMIWHPEHQADIWRAWDTFKGADVEWISDRKSGTIVKAGEGFTISVYLQKGKRALLVAANLSGQPKSAELVLNRKAFGFRDDVRLQAKDESAGQTAEIIDDRLDIEVDDGTFRLVSIWQE